MFFHLYESHYGELAQIIKLENRMKEAFPDDPRLSSFSQRFVHDRFDPTAVRPLISPATQARPKIIISVETAIPPSRQPSPPPIKIAPITNSPKRPLPLDDFDNDANRPRKLARGESPLAGAAGRRLNQLKQSRHPYEPPQPVGQVNGYMPSIPPLPREINYLLGIIPPASTYNIAHFNVDKMIQLIRDTPLPQAPSQQPPPHANHMGNGQFTQTPPGHYQGKPAVSISRFL